MALLIPVLILDEDVKRVLLRRKPRICSGLYYLHSLRSDTIVSMSRGLRCPHYEGESVASPGRQPV